MANFAFGSKYFIFSKFSSIPKTSKIEQDRADLIKEFNDFNEFSDADELKAFNDLGKYLDSNEHKNLYNKIEKEKTAEEGKIKLFENQKKSKKFQSFFKFKASQKLADFTKISKSEDLESYEELKEIVNSANFANDKNKLTKEKTSIHNKEKQFEKLEKNKAVKKYLSAGENDKVEKTSEVVEFEKLTKEIESGQFKERKDFVNNKLAEIEKQEKEYKLLSKSKPIKFYFKFKDSTKYKDFVSFKNSKELADYIELEKYLASSEHKELLAGLSESEAAEKAKIKEHEDFKSSKKYKWYLELKDSSKFNSLKKWKVVFEDDFTGGKLDTDKWMTRYYWGDKLMNGAYALDQDKAFPTDGANIETQGTLKIMTKRESIEGKKWQLPFGFVPQKFDFTTGLVSTAKSYRLKYGKVEAKIKVNYAKPVNYNFWMASEKNLPHVDILKLDKKKTKINVGNVYGDISKKDSLEKKMAEFSGLDVSQDFFIYTLIWTKDKLIWKINEVVVNEQTHGIPHEEMYLVFSSSITGKTDGSGLPASMEIDWVRCYQEG
ncbi:MAG: family 16 glycosylhydrolase [Bacteroidales bacterium]|nr:family 16 glycosylhydrolase [Bacteroidales bacterium]MCF8404306.1 family 16 glycosylhydrolase [Bacteroidales bacterium]